MAGGLGYSQFAGELTATATLSAQGISLENADTLDSVAGDSIIDFSLFVGGNGVDGFTTTLPAGATTCFDAFSLPANVDVFVGANKQVMSGRFNLEDLGVCQ